MSLSASSRVPLSTLGLAEPSILPQVDARTSPNSLRLLFVSVQFLEVSPEILPPGRLRVGQASFHGVAPLRSSGQPSEPRKVLFTDGETEAQGRGRQHGSSHLGLLIPTPDP